MPTLSHFSKVIVYFRESVLSYQELLNVLFLVCHCASFL